MVGITAAAIAAAHSVLATKTALLNLRDLGFFRNETVKTHKSKRRNLSPPFYTIPFFVDMGYWQRLLAGFQDSHGYDAYGASAYKKLAEVRRYHRKKYGDEPEILYEQEGKILQYQIDAMNNQGGLHNHKYALARWQIYKALYPDYISDEPPKIIKKVWLDPRIED